MYGMMHVVTVNRKVCSALKGAAEREGVLDMSQLRVRTRWTVVAAVMLTLGVFGATNFTAQPADAQINPFGCPNGFVFVPALSGCVPITGSICPAGSTLSGGFCVPISGSTCPAGSTLSGGVCVLPATAPVSVAATPVSPGCNEVVIGNGVGAVTQATTIVTLVQPSGIVNSIWQYNNPLHVYLAIYFASPGAPVDATTAVANQSVFICVTGGGAASSQTASQAQTTQPGTCPVGSIATNFGCVPVSTAQGCPIGFVPVIGGCLPIGSAGCNAGFPLANGNCIPPTQGGGCPFGFFLAPSLGGCVPLQNNGFCPVGSIINLVTGICTLIR